MRVSTTEFSPGTRVELFAPGAYRPGEGTNGDEHQTVTKDGLVAFDVKGFQVGQAAWLAGDDNGTWRTVQASVKDGKAEDAEHPGQRLAAVATTAQPEEEDLTVGARQSKTSTPRKSSGDPNDKLKFASNLAGAEALRVSASGSFVTIPDGSHADPAAHQPVVPAHTDGLTAEQRMAKADAKRKHAKQTGQAKARPKKSAQAESTKSASGQPTKAEATIEEPVEPPEGELRTAL